MRNLRAELREWDDNAPVSWTPSEGGILVGRVREPASFDSEGRVLRNPIVEEERSGALIMVDLAPERLAAVFELHNPHVSERIGVKCLRADERGDPRYALVVDRESDPVPIAENSSSPDSSKLEDCQASAEERDYLVGLLAEDGNEDLQSSKTSSGQLIDGLLQRRQEESRGSASATRHFERMVAGPTPSEAQLQAESGTELSGHEPVSSSGEVTAPTGQRKPRLWKAAIVVIALASGALSTAVLHFKVPLPW